MLSEEGMRIEVNGSRNRSRWQLGRVLIELHCWHLGPPKRSAYPLKPQIAIITIRQPGLALPIKSN